MRRCGGTRAGAGGGGGGAEGGYPKGSGDCHRVVTEELRWVQGVPAPATDAPDDATACGGGRVGDELVAPRGRGWVGMGISNGGEGAEAEEGGEKRAARRRHRRRLKNPRGGRGRRRRGVLALFVGLIGKRRSGGAGACTATAARLSCGGEGMRSASAPGCGPRPVGENVA